MSKPLEGIKVIEIGQEIQGPFAGLVLADMGASVIKIENRETGDLSRWLTCRTDRRARGQKSQEVSFYFTAMNRGKRSITLDLKKPGGVALIHRLAKSCDVLLTNYRPGVLDRLGLGFDDLLKDNPQNRLCAGEFMGAKRAVGQAAEPRHAGAGGERPDGEDRDARGSATGGGNRGGRPFGSAQPGGGRAWRAVRARAHRQGPAGRRVNLSER